MAFKKMMELAFWMSAICAFLYLPIFAVGLADGFFGGGKIPLLHFGGLALQLLVSLAACFCYVAFMVFLNKYASYSGADKALKVLIVLQALGILMLIGMMGTERGSVDGVLTIVFVVFALVGGVALIFFGIRTARCPNELFGYRGLISKINIATGICSVTVVLLIVTPVIGVFMYIVYAMMFHKARQLAETMPAE